MRKNERGITLIALVVTIVVLLILAGVSISMLTGENGIITQAQKSKLQTEIGKEKEYITLSVSAVKGDKISRGDTSEITNSELQNEINNYTDEATVTGSGTLKVTYESGRSYEVEQDGSITQKEELTPEEAKKIVFATGCGEALLVETADEKVYYVENLQQGVMQKIEITDAEIITTNGIREAGEDFFIDNNGKMYVWVYYSMKPEILDVSETVLNGKNITNVQSYEGTKIALDSEGKVYTWGNNDYGQLGDGTNEDSDEPICISEIEENALNGKNIVEIKSDGFTIIALDSEGKVYTWGYNSKGQLGNGTGGEWGNYSNVPICISDIEGNKLKEKNIVKVQNSYDTMIALDNEGKVYTWGYNWKGCLGNGTNVEYSNEPQCISDIPENALNGKNIVEVKSDVYTIITLDSEGKVYIWGNGLEEIQCISDTLEVLKGKKIVEINTNRDISTLIDSDGKLYVLNDEIICITENESTELYNKKIKLVNMSNQRVTNRTKYLYFYHYR